MKSSEMIAIEDDSQQPVMNDAMGKKQKLCDNKIKKNLRKGEPAQRMCLYA